MKSRIFLILTAIAATTLVGSIILSKPSAAAQRETGQPPARIAWYATLKSGLTEAKRSNRPILFTSAAPQCVGVSGIW